MNALVSPVKKDNNKETKIKNKIKKTVLLNESGNKSQWLIDRMLLNDIFFLRNNEYFRNKTK